jgi:hypothetical protein
VTGSPPGSRDRDPDPGDTGSRRRDAAGGSIDASLTEIRGRYGNDDDYHADLERIGLDALPAPGGRRDLVVEAVLERVAAQAAAVSETDVEIFWYMHKDRFDAPKRACCATSW